MEYGNLNVSKYKYIKIKVFHINASSEKRERDNSDTLYECDDERKYSGFMEK
jgi:hypothetical protein